MRLRKRTKADQKSVELARMADAFAHPLRVDIFKHILRCNRERLLVRNKDLVDAFGYSQATISQHINTLCSGGLLTTRSVATSTCYYANIGAVSKLIDEISRFGERGE